MIRMALLGDSRTRLSYSYYLLKEMSDGPCRQKDGMNMVVICVASYCICGLRLGGRQCGVTG